MAADHFTANFQVEGFVDDILELWKDVKRRSDSRVKGVRSTRNILTGETGNPGWAVSVTAVLSARCNSISTIIFWFSFVSVTAVLSARCNIQVKYQGCLMYVGFSDLIPKRALQLTFTATPNNGCSVSVTSVLSARCNQTQNPYYNGKDRFSDLSPKRVLQLTAFLVNGTPVVGFSDLSPKRALQPK